MVQSSPLAAPAQHPAKPSVEARPQARQRRAELLISWGASAALYLVLLWLYWPSLKFESSSLRDQALLETLGRLPLLQALGHAEASPLRPASNLFLWLLARSGQLLIGRSVLLGLFLLTTAFVQFYASERGKSWVIGLASAACFALSPTSASVVLWLSASHVGLCAPALLSYVLCGQRVLDRTQPGAREAIYVCGALLALVLALAAYELAVLAPLLLVLYHALLAPAGATRPVRWLYAGSVVCVASHVCLQLCMAGAARWWSSELAWPLLASALRYHTQNFMLWASPWGRFGVLVPDPPTGTALANASCWLLTLGFVAMLWKLRRYDPVSVFGFAWFLLFSIAAGTLLHFQAEPVAQYHLYLPMLGFTFAGARVTIWLLERLSASIANRRRRTIVDVLISVAFFSTFVPLVAECARTIEAWGDDEQLYLRTLENYPDNAEVLGRLTETYLARTPRAGVSSLAHGTAPAAGGWDSVLDALLMRPPRELPAQLIRRGRELFAHGRSVEAGSAFARALLSSLDAGANEDDHFAAGQGLVGALLQLGQQTVEARGSARELRLAARLREQLRLP